MTSPSSAPRRFGAPGRHGAAHEHARVSPEWLRCPHCGDSADGCRSPDAALRERPRVRREQARLREPRRGERPHDRRRRGHARRARCLPRRRPLRADPRRPRRRSAGRRRAHRRRRVRNRATTSPACSRQRAAATQRPWPSTSPPRPCAARCGRRGSDGLVADTWRPLPLRDGCADAVITVFAPRNLPEFHRILRPDGRLIVVVPSGTHLRELRADGRALDVPADKAERLQERGVAALRP